MWKRAFKVLAPLSCLWEYSYDNRKCGGSYRKFNSTKAEMVDALAGYFSGIPWSPPVLCWKMEVRIALAADRRILRSRLGDRYGVDLTGAIGG